jgi:hypothetical protein
MNTACHLSLHGKMKDEPRDGVAGGGLQNEPNFVQAGVDISKKQSQKRTQFRGVVDWQNGLSEGKTKPN